MSGTNHPVTWCHIPEEKKSELHHCKSRKIFIALFSAHTGTLTATTPVPPSIYHIAFPSPQFTLLTENGGSRLF
jgi:hypothetical protein